MQYVSALGRLAVGTVLALAAGAPALGAQPNYDLIKRALEGALPPIIGTDNSELVATLQSTTLGTPIRRRFDPDAAVKLIFEGMDTPTYDPECTTAKPQSNPDPGECTIWTGNEKGKGPYVGLTYSKNLAEGNIAFRSRPPVVKPTIDTLEPVDLADDAAFDMAKEFLTNFFGLPPIEIPTPPKNAANPTPFVSDQAIGFSARYKPVVVRKVITLPRGIKLKSPIVVDKERGINLPFIPAPGNATVVIDNTGITAAQIQGWQELRVNKAINPKLAKTRQDLINEIANDLMDEGGGTLGHISAHLVYGSDWRGKFGYLVPAVRILVAPVAGEQSPEQLRAHFDAMTPTAGFIQDYPLVPPAEPDAGVSRQTP
jgi:hypothetical protein